MELSRQFVKRTFDIVVAALLLMLLAPLLISVAVLIRREEGGPVFFYHDRIGYNGRLYRLIKFRSMAVDADATLERWKQSRPELWARYCTDNFKLADDPRVTRVGRWIRRTSIDELPQLWNVLRGDMSLVGPRPLLAREIPDYGKSINIYKAVRPGITGLWQVSGRSTTTFKQRITMDRWYVRNWSLCCDLGILARTVRVVFRGDGAH
jgi:Undecaprenyl-phosphate galactose phosphotransferase WbaP